MVRRSSSCLLGVVLFAVIANLQEIDAAVQTTPGAVKKRSNFEIRDVGIRKALLSISVGKLPPTDDQLIALIAENLREAAIEAGDPSLGIEAAARQAQEAVSEVTAAYTAVIFQSTSAAEAGRLFNRFEKTITRIVDFAKSGDFIKKNDYDTRYNETPQKTNAHDV